MSQKVQQLKVEIQDGREGSLMNSLDIVLYILISFFSGLTIMLKLLGQGFE